MSSDQPVNSPAAVYDESHALIVPPRGMLGLANWGLPGWRLQSEPDPTGTAFVLRIARGTDGDPHQGLAPEWLVLPGSYRTELEALGAIGQVLADERGDALHE